MLQRLGRTTVCGGGWCRVTAAGVLLAIASTSVAARPPRCGGRYVVRTTAGTLAPAAAVVLDAAGGTVAAGCGAARARIRRVRNGWLVSARFARCESHRRLRLRLRVAADCSFLAGTVAARHAGRGTFTATASRCGDGIVDVGGEEECDDGNLFGGDVCDPTCRACDSGAGPLASSWEGVQTNVFARYGCTRASCHGGPGSGGLGLASPAAYDNLVDVPASAVPALHRVEPGDERASFLWLKLGKAVNVADFGDVAGSGMPPDGALTPDELDAVTAWIRAGAPRTSAVPGTEVLLAPCRPRPPAPG